MAELYKLGECPCDDDWVGIDNMLSRSGIGCRNILSWDKPFRNNVVGILAIKTGEMRPPKIGEWYIYGTKPRAWKAKNNYQSPYEIAKLVTARTKTKTQVTEIPKSNQ